MDKLQRIFRRVFEELASNSNGLVDYDKLQQRVVSTGKFYVGEAVLMIEQMERTGRIEKTRDYNMYRRRIAASPEQKHRGDGRL